jgi:hypothetical protein
MIPRTPLRPTPPHGFKQEHDHAAPARAPSDTLGHSQSSLPICDTTQRL